MLYEVITAAIEKFADYICAQTLTVEVKLVDTCSDIDCKEVEIDNEITTFIHITKA